MSNATQPTLQQQWPDYELSLEPDGTSWTDRENLTDILQRELLGPGHGENELLVAPPDSLYLVGRIAPAKLTGTGGVVLASDDESEPTEAVPADEADLGRGVPVGEDSVIGGSDDEGAEDVPVKRGTMIPASMGMRFQVSSNTSRVAMRASWGTYRSEQTDEVTKNGRPIRKYRRTPHEHLVIVPVSQLTPGATANFPLEANVVMRVDVADVDRGAEHKTRIVEVALCNDHETPRNSIPMDAWLYQTQLFAEADVNSAKKAIFLPVKDVLTDPNSIDSEPEIARLQLQYRDRLEFAIGRTCSVDWTVAAGERKATQVRTTWLPISETPQTRANEIPGALLDMVALSEANADQLEAGLRPIINEYSAWLDKQENLANALPEHLRDTAKDAVQAARRVSRQLESGLEFLLADVEAQRCFAFMNRVMADQRIHTQVAELRTASPNLSISEARTAVVGKGSVAHSWRTFQLPFILMQIEALANPAIRRRSSAEAARAELLFFPTGGGKTEAYLGLAAFTFAIRRRQGVIETPEGRINGLDGVAVLMRYTLRLLTAQQFQRATALVCAAEIARRSDPRIWGEVPFRIGLWVGTAVSPKRYDEAEMQLEDATGGARYGLTVLQLQRCPWCGTPIKPGNDLRADSLRRRILVFCGDQFRDCPFSRGGSGVVDDEGLPVLTVDEEIYRLAPAFVIATVDKFARLAREGEAASLFGYVRKRCERHGYIHSDQEQICKIEVGGKHPTRAGQPSAGVTACDRLRPPDLIIQDELHLITGALGTAVGAFELAVDVLCTWVDAEGHQIRPLVVASTATVRNAADQIAALYGRKVTIFPPQVLDASDTFFSRDVPVIPGDPKTAGRRYIGVSTTGTRLTAAEIFVAATLLSAGQVLIDNALLPPDGQPTSADPYLTLVGYFNATRELAGMARFVADDITTAVRNRRQGKFFPRRFGTTGSGELNFAELTSRVSSADITGTLGQMAISFDPEYDSTQGSEARKLEREAAKAAGKRPEYRTGTPPFDVVLATSMLQVGVDVTRLGLMLMVGQPKQTAEYIQASSRVGRDYSRPGLVVTLGNWARPRDLAHYEHFKHYHETFYSQVEPLSVTPYSFTSLERSLDGVLVSAARVLDATRPDGLSAERSAWRIEDAEARVESFIAKIGERALIAGRGEEAARLVTERLKNRLGQWLKRKQFTSQKHQQLVYERFPQGKDGDFAPLVRSPASSVSDNLSGPPFKVANSMREVQSEINLLVSPVKDRMMSWELENSPPAWVLPSPISEVKPEANGD